MSDDRFDNRRYHNEDTFSIQSTAGAVPVRNKKGEISMEKVKVNRYVSGKNCSKMEKCLESPKIFPQSPLKVSSPKVSHESSILRSPIGFAKFP